MVMCLFGEGSACVYSDSNQHHEVIIIKKTLSSHHFNLHFSFTSVSTVNWIAPWVKHFNKSSIRQLKSEARLNFDAKMDNIQKGVFDFVCRTLSEMRWLISRFGTK